MTLIYFERGTNKKVGEKGMEFINPSFQEKNVSKDIKRDVRKQGVSKRKKRSDAKYDIRVYFTLEEKQRLKLLAIQGNMALTPFCSQLLKRELIRNNNYDVVEHQTSGKPVEIKLEKEFNDLLMDYCIEWDCSKRKAAHRILKSVLYRGVNGL
jgi:flavin-dependent dehydrogenase